MNFDDWWAFHNRDQSMSGYEYIARSAWNASRNEGLRLTPEHIRALKLAREYTAFAAVEEMVNDLLGNEE